jgi:anti-sigma regulatory factor (Ser/Thr protein kinase)
MEMRAVPVTERSQVGEVRRAVLVQSAELGWGETDCGTAALIVTEAGTNLVKHATQGVILFGVDTHRAAVEFLILDRGPGLPWPHAMTDGFSTTGTAGLGLGSVARLATESEVYSNVGGTAIFARYQPGRKPVPAPASSRSDLSIGALSVAKPHEEVCGDATAVHRIRERTLVVMADGLGHGPAAREAADAVLAACGEHAGRPLPEILEAAHAAARHTRGAAVLLVEIDEARRLARACGAGNISGQIIGPDRTVQLVSGNGTVGLQMNRIREFTYPWDHDSTLVMYSDGLQSRLALDAYPGWGRRQPMLVAGLLFRDFSRGRDDAAVIVVRGAGEPSN